MHIALIGCGEVGRCLASALSPLGEVELTVCEKNNTQFIKDFALSHNAINYASLGDWLTECDAVLSCVVGTCAQDVAEEAAAWLRPGTAYLDFTTASPMDMRALANLFADRHVGFADVAIMGAIASNGIATPLLIAGDTSTASVKAALRILEQAGAPVRLLENGTAGDAATLKLLRSVFTKGMEALSVECLVCAEHFGVRDQLYDILGDIDRAPLKEFLNMLVTTHLLHAERRWHEVDNAITQLEAAELPPRVMLGVREVFERTVQADWKKNNNDALQVSVEEALLALKTITQCDRHILQK